jgi:hypothetical protein
MKLSGSNFYSDKFFVIFLFFVFLISCDQNGTTEPKKDNDFSVKTFRVKDTLSAIPGWGYDIYAGKNRIIHQPIIPAIEGVKPFKTEKEAFDVGTLSIYKMKNGNSSLPSISLKELDSLQVVK